MQESKNGETQASTKRRRFPRALASVFALTVLAASYPSSPARAQGGVIASGQFLLPFATSPTDPNSGSALIANHTLPTGLGPTAGAQLVLALRDLTQPNQTCDPNDIIGGLADGCAVVDWPDPPFRGVNEIRLQLTSGLTTYHLRKSGQLSTQPEPPSG